MTKIDKFNLNTEPIAIIGMGCRFPGANNLESYWKLLLNGVDAITEVPRERWNIDNLYSPIPATSKKMITRWGGFLENVDRFDSHFFEMSPKEARSIDPQQRLFLEVAWEALEHSGIVPFELAGSKTGVFVGISNYDYNRLLCKDYTHIDAYGSIGTTLGITANRLSYLLNLRGPGMAIDTACSSSLASLHLACQSLKIKESNLALAGGVNLILSPEVTISFSQARLLAADGRCKTFDDSANGYVRSEGCGVIVLKRLSDALKNKDGILALVKGSALNHNGLSNGLTAPNGNAQQMVICEALESSGVAPSQISYVEAHGSGTLIGDSIEFSALKTILMKDRSNSEYCAIGSVKTNIGHAEAASGIAGLIKVVLSLKNEIIPPNLHLKKLNRYISLDLENTPFFIPTECHNWSKEIKRHRFAGISMFGAGGANAHVIIEEAPVPALEVKISSIQQPLHLFSISAKSQEALLDLVSLYTTFLAKKSEISIKNLCFSTNTKRSHFSHRLAFIVNSKTQLQEKLTNFTFKHRSQEPYYRHVQRRRQQNVVFLFAGEGSQYIGMGRQLYETQPSFRTIIQKCDELLNSYLNKSLLSLIYPDSNTFPLLQKTVCIQSAIFAFEYALAQLWISWGIEPTIVVGHGVGEYVAACIAGIFSWEDGLKLVAERSRLVQSLHHDGEMINVFATQELVSAIITPYVKEVSIAAINSVKNIVISGKRKTIQKIINIFDKQKIKWRNMGVSYAYHSPLIEPILNAFELIASEITYSKPQIKIISNVTGQLQKGQELSEANYWCRHLRESVKFSACMKTLYEHNCQLFIEISSSSILLEVGKQSLQEESGVWLSSLTKNRNNWQQLLENLRVLYLLGVKINWTGFHRDYQRSYVTLPTYPFQRERCWFDVGSQQ